MRLAEKHCFLMLGCNGPNALRILPFDSDPFQNWSAQTRMSPIFGILKSGDGEPPPTESSFNGEWYIALIGPVNPCTVEFIERTEFQAYATLGLLNLLLLTKESSAITELRTWLVGTAIPFEIWTVRDGVVVHMDDSFAGTQHTTTSWRETLQSIWERRPTGELREAIEEYCPLMASSIARAEAVAPRLAKDLIQINEAMRVFLARIIKDGAVNDSKHLGQVLIVNASLSRFSSQTFAGTPPILQTECHFWLHSLLGAGLATLAMHSICSYMDRVLGGALITERFEELCKRPRVCDLSVSQIPDADYLGQFKIQNFQPGLPHLGYFSARDGYRSTEWSISAPLAAISACNSKRWSLLTLTHEFTHVITRSLLAQLLPNIRNKDEIRALYRLTESEPPATERTMKQEFQLHLLYVLLQMDKAAQSRSVKTQGLDEAAVFELIRRWRQDIDEIMVHVFDFMYFYGKSDRKYVAAIWSSWGTIPNVSHRVLDYVVRTVCAVLSKHLRRGGDAETTARDQVLKHLRALAKIAPQPYLDEAIELLTTKWESVVAERVRARRVLVKFVASFLFSETIATRIRQDRLARGGAKDGYQLNKMDLMFRPFENPLRFLEAFTEAAEPNPAHSAWMLYALAFGIQANG